MQSLTMPYSSYLDCIIILYKATANNQLTINPKDGKCLLWDRDEDPLIETRQYCCTKILQ